uniref:NADH-ubiquinone oxidoreductase chain 3 n=1 Tax=Macrophiothrix sp. TaxID=3135532 RepID=A0AAU6PWX9_9ECHI
MLIYLVVISILLTALLTFLGNILPSMNLDLNKTSPYECGFDPINSARLPFSFRFFLVAILFLIFDLEIALLIATPFLFNTSNSLNGLLPVLIFLFILTVGLWYEWENNGLDWVSLI